MPRRNNPQKRRPITEALDELAVETQGKSDRLADIASLLLAASAEIKRLSRGAGETPALKSVPTFMNRGDPPNTEKAVDAARARVEITDEMIEEKRRNTDNRSIRDERVRGLTVIFMGKTNQTAIWMFSIGIGEGSSLSLGKYPEIGIDEARRRGAWIRRTVDTVKGATPQSALREYIEGLDADSEGTKDLCDGFVLQQEAARQAGANA
jgi:hypothetical protein